MVFVGDAWVAQLGEHLANVLERARLMTSL